MRSGGDEKIRRKVPSMIMSSIQLENDQKIKWKKNKPNEGRNGKWNEMVNEITNVDYCCG